jgi:hypothetical protein
LDRLLGDLDAADRFSNEAYAMAAPRKLLPSQVAALVTRAHTYADRYAQTFRAVDLRDGRTAADAAHRLATGISSLPWSELEALEAHAHLDRVEGYDHLWHVRAATLRHQLAPDGLLADPVTRGGAEGTG